MGREKQNNYYVVNQFLANVPFLHPLKTGESLLLFRCALRMKKRKIDQKRVNNLDKEIISIRNNATLIYGINVQNTTSIIATNNNVINGITIFISEKITQQFKG